MYFVTSYHDPSSYVRNVTLQVLDFFLQFFYLQNLLVVLQLVLLRALLLDAQVLPQVLVLHLVHLPLSLDLLQLPHVHLHFLLDLLVLALDALVLVRHLLLRQPVRVPQDVLDLRRIHVVQILRLLLKILLVLQQLIVVRVLLLRQLFLEISDRLQVLHLPVLQSRPNHLESAQILNLAFQLLGAPLMLVLHLIFLIQQFYA